MSLDFEDLCLDPFQANFDDGHREGSEAGLQAGYNEGRKLGQQKAVEVGIELGYMRGVAEAIRQSIVTSISASSDDKNLGETDDTGATLRKMEKIGKSANELLSMIDAFPSPDEIFQQATDDVSEEKQQPSHGDGEDSNAEESGDSEQSKAQSGGPVDISGRMQRIRAKFKLLCVQLKMPEISLSRVMEEAKKDAGKNDAITNEKDATGGNLSEEITPGGDQDW